MCIRDRCVLIAGDIYDKAVPSAEAVLLLDQFISRLAEMNVKVVAISGNHDSPERIGFGAEIMSTSGVSVSYTHLDVYKRQVYRYSQCHFPELRLYGFI